MRISSLFAQSSFQLGTSFGLNASGSSGSSNSSLTSSLSRIFDSANPDLLEATLLVRGASRDAANQQLEGADASSSRQSTLLGDVLVRLQTVRTLVEQGLDSDDAGVRAAIQTGIDASISAISSLADVSLALGGAANAQVSELDSSQVADLKVLSLQPNANLTVEGTVTQAAERATISVVGTERGAVAETVSVTLSGNLGDATLTLRAGESFEDVAEQINELSSATGVVAATQNNQLVLTSTTVGSASRVSLTAVSSNGTLIEGLDTDQLSSVNVSGLASGSFIEVGGSIDQVADRAEVRYVGAKDGTAAQSTTFTLSGNQGSIEVELTAGESLKEVADQINRSAEKTGVTASVDGNELVLRSLEVGSNAFVSVEGTESTGEAVISGGDANQISLATLDRATAGVSSVISGSVVTAASRANLTLVSTDGKVADTASFNLTGQSGTSTIEITAGESIDKVADRINDLSQQTGVTARRDGNNLVLESTELGSAGTVNVELLDVEKQVEISGNGLKDVDEVRVSGFTSDASVTLSGEVTRSARRAKYEIEGGSGNRVDESGTWTLTGTLGSVEIEVEKNEKLSAVAERINAESASTGIVAKVKDNDLILESAEVGSEAFIEVEIKSGLLGALGFSETDRVEGQDAEATINGQEYVAKWKTFTLDLAEGTVEIDVTEGFKDDIRKIKIVSSGGAFELQGGDGKGTSVGTDVQVEVDGEIFTGVGATVSVQTSDADVTLDFVEGFSGEFTPLTIDAPANFELKGGGASAKVSGTDTVATINGRTVVGEGSSLSFSIDGAAIELEIAAGFTGTFNTFTIEESTDSVELVGGDESGTAYGSDVEVEVNGTSYTGTGNLVSLDLEGVEFELTIADGFSGDLDPITISAASTGAGSDSEDVDAELQTLAQALAPLVSGGAFALDSESAADALTLIDEVTKRITRMEELAQANEAAETIDPRDPREQADARAAAKAVALAFRQYALSQYAVGLEAIDLDAHLTQESRLSVLALLQ